MVEYLTNMNKRIRKLIINYKDKAILVTDSKDIYYLTGAGFDGFWLLLYKNNIFAITSKMVEGQVKHHFGDTAKITVILPFSDALAEICKKYKIKDVCIDISNTNIMVFDAISKKLLEHKINVSKITGLTNDLRIIKDKTEIENIKTACNIVSKVYENVKKQIVAGMTELDIHFKIEEEFAKNHVVASFKTIVASGPNSSNPHHISGNRKILKNDMVLIDMGCIYNGYCSDLTRIAFLGKITSMSEKVWSLVKQAHDMSLLSVEIGNKCSIVDSAARDVIKKTGFGDKFIHGTGHGVGLNIHESPSVSQNSKEILKENMVITIEPGIYIPNKFGIRIEDTVLVTKNGCEILTNTK
ncbi:MAG: Xaa-Pro peptidase family protein [Endomicrobiaceae bacterium]|nr:Xaa-Pro peptidase family protein [Endomicrobiaceae bacterium]